MRATAFQAQWTDIQTDRLLANGLPFTANIGDGRNKGFELDAIWRSGDWTLEGDLLLNDPELARPDPGFPIPADRHLSGIPGVLMNAAVRREWRPRARYRVQVGAEVGYVGESRLTFDADLAPRMGNYLTSRLTAGITADRWTLSAYADNLAGDDGDTFAFGNPFRLRYMEPQTPQRPRTVGVLLQRTFGD